MVTPLRDEPPRPLPANEEVEQRLLGGLLRNNGAYHEIADLICRGDFRLEIHGRIFAVIASAIERGDEASPAMLRHVFDGDPALQKLGGGEYLAKLVASVASESAIPDQARLIADLALRRDLIGELDEPEPGQTVASLLEPHRARIERVANGATSLAGIDPSTLDGRPVPERKWLVDHWVPMRRVTGLYGIGGAGKTLALQMLATACAIEVPWLGLQVRRCRSALWFAEDDVDEMHARQDAINRHYGCSWADLADMRWFPRLGKQNVFMNFERGGRSELTQTYREFLAAAKAHGARMIAVDTISDTFGGDEIVRSQVRRFVQECLAHLARDLAAAVIGAAHPSQTGINRDTGESGSTGWRGGFRAHLYLKFDGDDRDTGEPVGNDRILTRKKANWARVGDTIELRWADGVLIPKARPMTADPGIVGSIARRNAERVFLDLLANMTAEKQPVSSNSRAGNYAPRLFGRRPDRERFRQADFEVAMQSLFAQKQIVNVPYGRKGDERTCIAAVVATVAAVCGGDS
jgi:RecA-family ATPase